MDLRACTGRPLLWGMHAEKLEFLLYLDDSGSRDPDKQRSQRGNESQPDWFGMGGILVNAKDKSHIEDALAALRIRWPQMGSAPLRSYDIRNRTKRFRWLADLDDASTDKFYADLSNTISEQPIVVAGCIVHRPGYNERYLTQYGPRRWKLCKTVFNIAVERAAKFAAFHNARLRVLVERSDKVTEQQLKGYYEQLRIDAAPFNAESSKKYQPLTAAQLKSTLFEFDVRTKESQLMQLADLVLWPICQAGYTTNGKPYQTLVQSGKLLDAHCTPSNGLLGIKYSCF